MQSIYSIETYTYGTSTDLVNEKEDTKNDTKEKIQKIINLMML